MVTDHIAPFPRAGMGPTLAGPAAFATRSSPRRTAGGLDFLGGGVELNEFEDLANSLIDTVKYLRALKD